MVARDENLGIAFGLVLGAGAATGLGAAVVFFPALVKLASRRTLAGALGLSAGVMTYVSFVEIFQKSTDSFVEAGKDEDKAYIYATLCFFLGVILMVTLNHVVTSLLGGHHHHHHNDAKQTAQSSRESNGEEVKPGCPCCDDDPAHTLEDVKHMAEEMEKRENGSVEEDEDDQVPEWGQSGENKKLMRMSTNTALAIGLHNFPEGLATFVAALDDPRVGAVLAIAIAIHNIPEGLCVAMPVYYATGDRWKAFGWAIVSGIAEPIAALLGWVILAQSFSDQLYGTLFGIVSGMMVIISVRELLPTAHRYDPEDSVVTYSFIAGMGIMALSLVLFLL